jgi:hypothetical protein
METMYDSIELDQIPADAKMVAGYVGGQWPTFAEVVRRWPHAQHLSIAIAAGEDADCLDIENGDATIKDAPGWFRRQRARGVALPWFYIELSKALGLIAELEQAGIPRHQYLLWTAHWNYVAHLCGPHEGLPTHADATQWNDRALGRNLDESLVGSYPTVSAAYAPPDELRWEHEYDQLLHKRGPRAALRRNALKRAMRKRIQLIVRLAEDNGWDTLNREARLKQLLTRTGGK